MMMIMMMMMMMATVMMVMVSKSSREFPPTKFFPRVTSLGGRGAGNGQVGPYLKLFKLCKKFTKAKLGEATISSFEPYKFFFCHQYEMFVL